MSGSRSRSDRIVDVTHIDILDLLHQPYDLRFVARSIVGPASRIRFAIVGSHSPVSINLALAIGKFCL